MSVTTETAREPILAPAPAQGPGAYVQSRGTVRRHHVFWSAADFARADRWWGRALANLGVRGGQLVAVHLQNPYIAQSVEAGAMALGARAWRVTGAIPADLLAPDVLVADVWTALAWPRALAPSLVVLTESLGGVAATRARIAERWGNLPVIRSAYALVEVPGPAAIECGEGLMHARSSEDPAEGEAAEPAVSVELLLPDGTPAPVGAVGELVISDGRTLDRFHTGDLARAAECPAGHPGFAFGEIVGRTPALTLSGRALYPTDLITALFRTPGFDGRATVTVERDRARGRDQLAVEIGVAPQWNPRQVAEAVAYSLAGRVGSMPRVEVREFGDHAPGVELEDIRVRG